VEDAFGTDLENKRAPVLAAVLSALATNYREGSAIERRRSRSRPVWSTGLDSTRLRG